MSIEFLSIEPTPNGFALEREKDGFLPQILGDTPDQVLDGLGEAFRHALKNNRSWPNDKTVFLVTKPDGVSVEIRVEPR